jgi:hypothetical protein
VELISIFGGGGLIVHIFGIPVTVLTVVYFRSSATVWYLRIVNPLNAELYPICFLLVLLAHHFLHVSRIMVKSLTFRLLMSYMYIYIYDISTLRVKRTSIILSSSLLDHNRSQKYFKCHQIPWNFSICLPRRTLWENY